MYFLCWLGDLRCMLFTLLGARYSFFQLELMKPQYFKTKTLYLHVLVNIYIDKLINMIFITNVLLQMITFMF